MSAVATNAVVATIALVAVLTRTACAIILVPCPTFFASSFVHDVNFHPHFLHFAFVFGTKDPDSV